MELDGLPLGLDQVKALALTNYGHFTSMRVEPTGRVRGLSLHLERLIRDARHVFDSSLDAGRVRYLLRRAVKDNGNALVARVTVYDPEIDLGRPGADAEPRVLVTVRPASSTPPTSIRLQSAVYSRDLPQVKHTGLFGALYHRRNAQRNGFDDVVFAAPDGTISEAATSNIGFVRSDGTIVWPSGDCLPGITMRLIAQVRDENVTSARIALASLQTYDAAFVTNAAVGVRTVTSIDDVSWQGEHALIRSIRKEYEDIPPERI